MAFGMKNSNYLAKIQYHDKKLREQDRINVARNEKDYASNLHMAGREAYFKEYFYDIKVENQELPKIGPFEKIEDTYNFKQGYQKGAFLVEIGAIPEEYKQIDKNIKKPK